MTTTPRIVSELASVINQIGSIPAGMELGLWNEDQDGATLWQRASTFVLLRPMILAAISNGFDKSGEAVLAFVEKLKGRAPGPPDPEIHTIDQHRVCVYLWRTHDGAALVAFQCSDLAVDQWKQLRAQRRDDGDFDLGPGVTRFKVPPRPGIEPEGPVLTLQERLQTPCHEPGCKAESVADCGHKSYAEKIGAKLPHSAEHRVECKPCSDAEPGSVKAFHLPPVCEESKARGTIALDKPKTVHPFSKTVYTSRCGKCSHVGTGKIHSVECSKCGDGHEITSWVGGPEDEPIDQDPGVQLDPTAPDDLRANPNWSPVSGTGTVYEEATPGLLQEDAVPFVLGEVSSGSGETVHCPGAWVPPGTEPFACSPSNHKSRLTFKAALAISAMIEELREELPGITCKICRIVITQVMLASQWLGPNLHPGSKRGWLEPLDQSALEKGKQNLGSLFADQDAEDEAAVDDLAFQTGQPPEVLPDQDDDLVLVHMRRASDYQSLCGEEGLKNLIGEGKGHVTCPACMGLADEELAARERRQQKARSAQATDVCQCGHNKVAHATDGACRSCPCIAFREGKPAGELETQGMRDAAAAKKRSEFIASLDMSKVTKQRTSSKYAQCKLCRRMIKGPVKDGKKTVTPGDEWVGPPAKTDKGGKLKTPSMNNRAHLACADEALLAMKETA